LGDHKDATHQFNEYITIVERDTKCFHKLHIQNTDD